MTDIDTGSREWLIRCFARYCWPRRNQEAPSGKGTWGDSFESKFGMTLYEYKDKVNNEDKQREGKGKTTPAVDT